MIKIFIPAIKGRTKTLARGFWKTPQGKIYYDYLQINKTNFNRHDISKGTLQKHLTALKIELNQECIFYIYMGKGHIFYSKYNIEVLPHRIYKEVLRHDLKKTIKADLKTYSGLTVYQSKGKYYIEIFTTL